ncbi:ribosome silencing factor [Limoniibacter endophyticus]|uniref:Ribosomal silencing factor RsfS n=1 Tax=Limoniibacter endophyticus TaxID=1565040 RepID=A0A8J3DPC9_9HYPH|nr:ribosome silencing factor [Limoniibacter endophyticus]GHC73777.1 ribosomal silencing factor RsfS [Limoniibacter endophyticus]
MSQSLCIRQNEDGQDALKPKGSTLRTAFRQKDETAPSPASTAYDPLLALKTVVDSLDDSKAENIVSIDIRGKSSLGDHLVIASGRSHRHVAAIADHLIQAIKEQAKEDGREVSLRVEGLQSADWVLVDTGDLIVHIFRPEVREFYNIEKMWQAPDLENTRH